MTRQSSNSPERSDTRILIGNYFADIVINCEYQTPIYYWIAQQVGSADIVGWGQEETFAAAEKNARQFLEERSRFTRSLATFCF
jgi:hypothetical protein